MVPRKPQPPPDPQRSGDSSSKGKGKADPPPSPPEDQADQPEPEYGAPDDRSTGDEALVVPPKAPKHEGKRARKARLQEEAEIDYAKYMAKRPAQQAGPNQEEVARFLAPAPPKTDPGP